MRKRRAGFTLVELLVAMALTVFIMMILTQAFGTGMETFKTLRSIGAMQNDLRSAAGLLKSDLEQSHFEGTRRLSDQDFWKSPVREGFFVLQGGTITSEGSPSDNSARANGLLHFTRRAKGNRRENFTLVQASGSGLQSTPGNANICQLPGDAQVTDTNSAGSQWAEVAWYLVSKPSTVSNLYSLYRTELLVVANSNFSAGSFNSASYPGFAVDASSNLLTAKQLATGTRGFRPGGDEATFAANKRASLMLDNVLSFRVQQLRAGDIDFVDVTSSLDTNNGNAGNPPIKAIRVTIRVCDPGNETTRQISMVQEL